jgi:hypothetical protein
LVEKATEMGLVAEMVDDPTGSHPLFMGRMQVMISWEHIEIQ